jgi:ATP-dependent Clp protease ATP-binding subunit ClpB
VEELEGLVFSELRAVFRPEFLNRVDDVIVFHSLGREELARIVTLQLARVSGLADELGIRLEVADEVTAYLAEEGYDPVFGARPLKRAVQRRVQDPLAMFLLEEEVPEGTVVRVGLAPDRSGLTFEGLPQGASEPVGPRAGGGA